MEQDTCITPNCGRAVYVKSRGLCSRCYGVRPDAPECSAEGCGRRGQLRKGLCGKCRQRAARHGDPHVVLIRTPGRVLAELRAAANATTDECIYFPVGHDQRPTVLLNGTTVTASRAVWIVAEGDPGDQHVLHTCHRGREGCINRRHLYLGDHQRNMDDMAEAGRTSDRRGTANGRVKLTEDQVREIRRAYPEQGVTQLAARYGVAKSTVGSIVSRKNWSWLE